MHIFSIFMDYKYLHTIVHYILISLNQLIKKRLMLIDIVY